MAKGAVHVMLNVTAESFIRIAVPTIKFTTIPGTVCVSKCVS